MRLFLLLLCCICGFGTPVSAQKTGSVTGYLQDTAGLQSLQGASITLLNASDSASTGWAAVSDGDAHFALSGVPLGSYLVSIRFEGYKPWCKHLTLDAVHPHANLGDVFLAIQIDRLDSIKIAPPPLVVQKNDTTEYNTGRLKTHVYDVLEDLLKKLPGIQLSADGRLLSGGEPIEQLLVDGKPFFGGDPAIALQNLPAEIVDQVQVYKARSDRELATGFNQGPGRTTINIVIKPNRRKGDFGKTGAGAGTQNTYSAGLNLNHFDGSRQLSLLGSADNTNNQNSPTALTPNTPLDVPDNTGIAKTLSGGINYRDSWNKALDGFGSYMITHQNTQNGQVAVIQNMFPGDSSTNSHQETSSTSKGNFQNFSFNLTDRIDKANTITFRPGFTIRESHSVSTAESFLTTAAPSDTLYRSSSQSSADAADKNAFADISWTHLLPRSSVLFVDLKLSGHNSNNTALDNTETDYLAPIAYTGGLNQQLVQTTKNGTISPSLSLTLPFDRHHALEFNYDYTWAPNRSSSLAARYDKASGKFDLIDSTQSNDFSYTMQKHTATIDYRLQFEKWQWTTGIGLQANLLSEKDLSSDSAFDRRYTGIVSTSGLEYTLGKNKNLQANYTGGIADLGIQQLQPVNTTADSLNIQKGNPFLKQPYTHSLSLSYRATQSTRIFSVDLSGTMVLHSIASSVTQLAGGAQVNMPVNVNGNFSTTADASYGLPVKQLWSMFTLSARLVYNQNPSLLNNVQSETRNTSGYLALSSSTNILDKLSGTVAATEGYSAYHYSFPGSQDTHFFTTRITANMKYNWKSWECSVYALYSLNSSLPPGFKKDIVLLSPVLTWRVFKKKTGEVKLFVFDLLNQNSGISRSLSANTIQDMQSEVRGRYGMLSFSYIIRHFPRH